MTLFNPINVLDRGAPPVSYRFQINHLAIDGELAQKARIAADRWHLSNTAFVTACVKFALENMEGA